MITQFFILPHPSSAAYYSPALSSSPPSIPPSPHCRIVRIKRVASTPLMMPTASPLVPPLIPLLLLLLLRVLVSLMLLLLLVVVFMMLFLLLSVLVLLLLMLTLMVLMLLLLLLPAWLRHLALFHAPLLVLLMGVVVAPSSR